MNTSALEAIRKFRTHQRFRKEAMHTYHHRADAGPSAEELAQSNEAVLDRLRRIDLKLASNNLALDFPSTQVMEQQATIKSACCHSAHSLPADGKCDWRPHTETCIKVTVTHESTSCMHGAMLVESTAIHSMLMHVPGRHFAKPISGDWSLGRDTCNDKTRNASQ